MLFHSEVSLRMLKKTHFCPDQLCVCSVASSDTHFGRPNRQASLLDSRHLSKIRAVKRSQLFYPRFQVNVMRGPGSKPSLLFQLVIPATAVFAVTVLSMIAIVFSDPRAPVAQFLDRHGNRLLAAEFAVVIVLSLLAMTVDRIQTLRHMRQQKNDLPESDVTQPTDQTSTAENKIAKTQTPSP